MKKKQLILFFALLAAGLGLRAQDGGQISAQDSIQDSTRHYASYFGENATEWTLGWCTMDYGFINHRRWVSGDTLIGDYIYKRVYVEPFPRNEVVEWDSLQYPPVWMREDTLTGRLWIRHAVLSRDDGDTRYVEYLACDMSLNVGDTFSMYYHRSPRGEKEHRYLVVRIEEEQGLRKIVLDARTRYHYLYEGVGHEDMFYSTAFGMGDYFHRNSFGYILGCVLIDDTVSFSRPNSNEFEDCRFKFCFGSVDESETPFAVSLYPNPCKERLQIANLPDGVQGLYVTDMLGRCVYSTAQPAEGIPTAQLPQGVYRLTMVMNDNQHYSLTFVKR